LILATSSNVCYCPPSYHFRLKDVGERGTEECGESAASKVADSTADKPPPISSYARSHESFSPIRAPTRRKGCGLWSRPFWAQPPTMDALCGLWSRAGL